MGLTLIQCYLLSGCLGDPTVPQMILDTCVGNLIKLGIYFLCIESLDTLDTCGNLYGNISYPKRQGKTVCSGDHKICGEEGCRGEGQIQMQEKKYELIDCVKLLKDNGQTN